MHDDTNRDAAGSLVDFARTLSDVQSVESVFRRLGDFSASLLGADGTGVLLLSDEALTVATASSHLGEVVERLEADLGEGPCTESIETSAHVRAPDLSAVGDRWPTFTPRALQAGVGGIYGLPMLSGADHPIGALNIVTAQPRELSERDLLIVDMLSEVAVSFLVAIRATAAANELAAQLQHALDSRVVIEQAKGMLAERHGWNLNEAFERIRTHSRSTGQRIHDVARQIVDHRLVLD